MGDLHLVNPQRFWCQKNVLRMQTLTGPGVGSKYSDGPPPRQWSILAECSLLVEKCIKVF